MQIDPNSFLNNVNNNVYFVSFSFFNYMYKTTSTTTPHPSANAPRASQPHTYVYHKMGQEKSLPSRCNSIHHDYPSLTGTHHSGTTTSSGSSATANNPHHTHHSHKNHHHHHHHHRSSVGSGALSSAVSSVSLAPSTRSSTSTINTNYSRASYKSVQRQTKYLNEQLYIKSYLDLEDQDRLAKKVFQQTTTKSGIRNYTPKILGEKQLNDNSSNSSGFCSNTLSSQTSSSVSNSNTLTSNGTLKSRDVDAWI